MWIAEEAVGGCALEAKSADKLYYVNHLARVAQVRQPTSSRVSGKSSLRFGRCSKRVHPSYPPGRHDTPRTRKADILTLQLNLAHVLTRSAANGPGERFVIWVQGCSLRCPGCWNPDTWTSKPRIQLSVDKLVSDIVGTNGIEGITLTGGEPFEQAASLASLCGRIRPHGLSVMAFTGYDPSELTAPEQMALLDCCDIVVGGRYMRASRAVGDDWRGSENQVVYYRTNRYSRDSSSDAEWEVHISPDGEAVVTGFPPDAYSTREFS